MGLHVIQLFIRFIKIILVSSDLCCWERVLPFPDVREDVRGVPGGVGGGEDEESSW